MFSSVGSNSEDSQDLVPKGLGCLAVASQRPIQSTFLHKSENQIKDGNFDILFHLEHTSKYLKHSHHVSANF